MTTLEPPLVEVREPELTTVADDEVVLFTTEHGFRAFGPLAPDTDHVLDGVEVRTLPRPPGELLASFATANDVHFGERVCGHIEGLESLGPPIEQPEDMAPYPSIMNDAIVADIAARLPDAAAVVVKGDLTTHGTREEYEAFLACYGSAFGGRLHHVRGNHDAALGASFAAWPTQHVELPGVTLALLDTTIPEQENGRIGPDQLEWLDDLAAAADRPVMVFGHHHCWSPDSNQRPDRYFGIGPDDSEALIELVARRPAIVGYFAGHTHRNRVRRFPSTGSVPFVEVSCTKDFPGAWAEYRVHEGGVLQVLRRVAEPAALAWAERTRSLFGGLYPQYAFGTVADRCFPIWPR